MVRIVYGVSGEGSGHAMRAAEVLEHLRERGHTVKVATYDRGLRALGERFDCTAIEGLSIGTSDNQVSLARTFADNLAKLSDGVRSLRQAKRVLFEDFAPQVVICDFEPMTAHLAHHARVPLITLDNQHLLRYAHFPVPDGLRREAALTLQLVRAFVPRPDVSLVTGLYQGSVTNRRTFLFPPLVERRVRELVPDDDGPVLAYFTKGHERALAAFATAPRERFVVYGYERDESVGNVTFRPASRAGFLEDLRHCSAVVATAGLTLMSEALYLGKPMLALPMRGQFEQELNAALLAHGAWGANGREFADTTLGDFLYRVPDFRARLRAWPRADSSALLAKLDTFLDSDAALAREFRERRDENSRPPAN